MEFIEINPLLKLSIWILVTAKSLNYPKEKIYDLVYKSASQYLGSQSQKWNNLRDDELLNKFLKLAKTEINK